MLLHMLLFGVFASNYATFLGPNMLQRGDYALLVKYATLWSIFFCVAQALRRRLCSCIYIMLLFDVFASNYAPFLGPNMLQRGDYAKYANI